MAHSGEDVMASVSRTLAFLAAACAAFVMLVIATDVAWRLVTGGSVRGAFELVETLLVLVVFLGIGHAERTRAHVRVTLVTRSLPPRFARWGRAVGTAAAGLTTAWMAYATTLQAIESVGSREFRMGLTNFPIWPARVAVAVGLVALTVEFAFTVRAVLQPDGSPAPVADPEART